MTEITYSTKIICLEHGEHEFFLKFEVQVGSKMRCPRCMAECLVVDVRPVMGEANHSDNQFNLTNIW
jgi:hypothetical protein